MAKDKKNKKKSSRMSRQAFDEVQFERPDLSERRERQEGVPDSVPFLHTVEQKY
jgi:hypothetical protein